MLYESLVFCILLFEIRDSHDVNVKIIVFWDMTPCSLEDIYHYFGAEYRNWLFGCEVSS